MKKYRVVILEKGKPVSYEVIEAEDADDAKVKAKALCKPGQTYSIVKL